jgi:hypothetical protein
MTQPRLLGKKAPRYDHRTLQMASYLDHTLLPPTPKAISWASKCAADFGMMLNDQIGDCTCATAGHMIQVWTANESAEITLTDDDIQRAYEEAGHYDPRDPTTDQGAVELDVLNYWRKTGIGGHQIGAYAALEPDGIHARHVRNAIHLFGGVYSGFALPATAQGQAIWSVVPHAGPDGDPGSWGGHAVPLVAYDPHWVWCITWGKLQRMTWAFVGKYMDEAYACISADWVSGGKAPSGFDYAALQADLARL